MKIFLDRALRPRASLLRWLRGFRSSWPRRAAALVLVVAFEMLGRLSPNDWIDGIGVAMLIGFVGLSVSRNPGVWKKRWNALGAFAKSRFAPFAIQYGLDLRGTPPLPARLPARWLGLLLPLLVLPAVLFLARGAFPSDFRDALRGASGFLYLAYLSLLWAILGLGTLVAWVAVFAFLAEWRPRWAATFGTVLFLASAAAFILLRPEWTLALMLFGFALHVLVASAVPPIPLVWRYARGARGSCGGKLVVWQLAFALGSSAILLLPALLAVGELFNGVSPRETLATSLLGRSYIASIATAVNLLLGYDTWELFRASRTDPARSVRTRVFVEGTAHGKDRRRSRVLLGAGFNACFRPRPGSLEVRVRLVSASEEESPAGTSWPLAVPLARFGDPSLHVRLARRDVVQRRRALARGLVKLLKSASRKDYARGSGFWIGCNHWFITHLTRDTDEEGGFGTIGSPYRKALHPAARSHWAQVLRDLEIDFLFLEDGVRFRQFQRVLALIFEYHDLFGRRRLEDERHFLGLPGVRVLIHDFELEKPLGRQGYPEPDYEEIGRARILHVFRDRHEGRERIDAPRSRDRRPASPRIPVLT